MKHILQILTRLYIVLLNLYPQNYRAEYGEELQSVFNLAIDEAVERGGYSAIWLGLRELVDLPKAIILVHWREIRKQKIVPAIGSFLTFETGSRREAIAALAPFLLFGAFSTFLSYIQASIPHWLQVVTAIGWLGLMLSLFVIGVVKRLPRWFLPYMGLPLPLFSYYVFFRLMVGPQVRIMPTAPWLLRTLVSQGLFWTGLLLAGILIVFIVGILPPLRPFYWRLRRDWTLLSFILYGAALFALIFTFDDYINEEPYKIVAMLLLAAGGWFYLKSAHPWRRFLALFAGLALAMFVAAAGKAILHSGPNVPYPHGFTWQTEAMSTIIMWVWLVVAISEPILINLLPYLPKDIEQ